MLLTGASSGLGPHLARRLQAEGAQLVLSARRQDLLEDLAAELVAARVIAADLALPAEPARLAAAAGAVDILISNAGLPASGELSDLEVATIDRALAVNLRAGIVLARLLAPGMVARGRGHLLFMGSMAAHVPGPGTSLYNATKFGIRGFALALRMELQGTGVGVSVVSPTYVSGAGMWAEATSARAPHGEVTPEAVAEAMVRAVERNRQEVRVAPPGVRVGARLHALLPELGERIARTAAAHPPEAIERQRRKR